MGKRKVISPEARKLKGLEKGLRMFSTLLNNFEGIEAELLEPNKKSDLPIVNISYGDKKLVGICSKTMGELQISCNNSYVTSRILTNLNNCTVGEVAKKIRNYD